MAYPIFTVVILLALVWRISRRREFKDWEIGFFLMGVVAALGLRMATVGGW